MLLWLVRLAWLALPLTAGPAVASALADASRPVEVVGSVLAWAAWAVVLVAVLVPRTTSLTLLRVGAPAALAVAGWAGVAAGGLAAVAAVAWGVLTVAVALCGPVTDAFVDGSSYGPERRLALRTPGLLLLGPVALAWAAVVAGVAAGPLLLAARSWVVGVVALVVGGPLAFVGGRALHTLSRRWVVFVPAGLVVHDPLALAEPALFPRGVVRRVGPAEVGVDAADLTGRALGLALHVALAEPVRIAVARGRRPPELVTVAGVLVTPARPGTLLAEARSRRLPVG